MGMTNKSGDRSLSSIMCAGGKKNEGQGAMRGKDRKR